MIRGRTEHCRDLIPCPEAGGSLSLPRDPPQLQVALPGSWCHQQCHQHGSRATHAVPRVVTRGVSSSLIFPRRFSSTFESKPRVPGAGVATGDAQLVALAVALSLAGQRCRAAVYYSGQVQLQHRVCSAAPRRLLLPGAAPSSPDTPGHPGGIPSSSGR